MDALVRFGSSKAAGLAGSIISVAIVFSGAVGRAEGLCSFSVADGATNAFVSSFSSEDLAQLEHATASEATAARLAALGADMPELSTARSRTTAPDEASVDSAADLFPHSGRVLPLLVTRADAATPVARVASTLRPGLVQPVGVSVSSLRSPTPAEQAAR